MASVAVFGASALQGNPSLNSSDGPSPHHLDEPAPVGRRGRRIGWLRRALRGVQAVAEERPVSHAQDEDDEADDASYDGGAAEPARHCCSFGSLPEHLLEKIFTHLRGTNRKHHFAVCGVNRQWRRLGQAMFFSRPWEVAHLICHPTQLFCLSPRNVTGSRSGLLKCFVRRENAPGGRRFTFHIGKDASQPQRSRFLMAAKQGGRNEVHLFLNSRCQGTPCARLGCNMFATQYKLILAEDLELEPTGTSRSRRAAEAEEEAAAAARRARVISRLSSWGAEAAAEAVAAAAAAAAAHRRALAMRAAKSGGGDGFDGPAAAVEELGVDCFADLQYQARVKGFMQPRRMRVVLPHPLLLFYDQQLPQLTRRLSECEGHAASGQLSPAPSGKRLLRSTSGSISGGVGAPPDGSPGAVAAAAAHAAKEMEAAEAGASSSSGGGLGGLLRRKPRLLRQQRTVPTDEALQPVVLQNKAPHWNEGLRCWCLNFRGRVKLASVKNFQLVRAGDPGERVVMQFGKAEQDAFILDFNPTVLTAMSAFGIALSTMDSKWLL